MVTKDAIEFVREYEDNSVDIFMDGCAVTHFNDSGDETVIGEFIRPEDIVRMAEESGLTLTSEYNYSRDDRFSHSCNLGVASFVFTKE